MAKRYLFSDIFHPEVSGSYLAGNPMAGDKVTYSLAPTPSDGRIFTSGGLQRYSFGLDRDLAQDNPPKNGDDKFNAGGTYTPGIPMSTFKKTNYLANLNYSVTGRSSEGKEFTARAMSVFFPGNLLTGIRVGHYQNLKEPVSAELALVDFQGKPASGEISVSLYQQYYENHQYKLRKIAGPEDIYVDKTKTHSFRVPKAGHYILRCDTPDANGRVVSTSGSFFAWDSDYSDRMDRLQIETDQPTLRVGDKLKCFIRSPRAGQALITVERDRVLDSRVMALQKMTPLEIPIKKEYFPRIRVSVIAMYENNQSEETSSEFQVNDEDRTLGVDLESPAEIKPASKLQIEDQGERRPKKGSQGQAFRLCRGRGQSLAAEIPDP